MKRRSFLRGFAGLPLVGAAVAASEPDPEEQPGPHIHTPGDGRGPRQAFVDGNPVEYVVYADTHRGIVRAHERPFRRLPDGSRATYELRGKVVVRPARR